MTKKIHSLNSEKRELTGRKVKNLRSQNLLPANVFGSKVESIHIQLSTKDFLKTYEETGDTGLIELDIKGEAKPRPVLVHLVQTHPVSGHPLHIDFRQVNLKEKLSAEVPIKLVGESEAVQQGGVLIHLLDGVEVEALPTDFPESIDIDISALKGIGDTLHVSDLKYDTSKLTLQVEPETIVAKVEAQQAEEAPAPTPVATEEGTTTAEGESKKEDEAGETKTETSAEKTSE